eukprot:CAMPEP_0194478918 /NCGR_PEP_ID=MMETSP0253-20130528/2208_1 /TAXON_ID=2966 /ORGANISM="Noctiluca scintillans" /LENGTH=91 /DNA_ID=CAMNT_0039318073 /DNA_START=217 /DNA_END=489 /DNA_ORIENTATION=-
MPASLNLPFFFSSVAPTAMTPSSAALTSFGFKPTVSATEAYTALAVIDGLLDAAAFIAAGGLALAFPAPRFACGAMGPAAAFPNQKQCARL